MQAWYLVFIIPVDFPEDLELQKKMPFFELNVGFKSTILSAGGAPV